MQIDRGSSTACCSRLQGPQTLPTSVLWIVVAYCNLWQTVPIRNFGMVYSTAQLNLAFSEVSTRQATEPPKCASYIMEWSWYGMPVIRKSHVRIVKASILWGVHQFSLQKCLQAKTDEVVRSYMTLATFRMNLTMSLAINVEAKAVFTLPRCQEVPISFAQGGGIENYRAMKPRCRGGVSSSLGDLQRKLVKIQRDGERLCAELLWTGRTQQLGSRNATLQWCFEKSLLFGLDVGLLAA